MKEDGADCFRRIIQNRKHPKIEPMIDGYSGFLFLDKNDMPMVALHWEKHFQHIREKYNSIYKVQMEEFRKAQAEVEQKKEKPMSQKMFKVV